MPFPNPSNITNPVDLINYVDTVTNVTDVNGNTVFANSFGLSLLLVIGFVFFMMFKTRYNTETAFVGSLFLTTLSSYLLWAMGLAPATAVVTLTLILSISIFLLFISDRG